MLQFDQKSKTLSLMAPYFCVRIFVHNIQQIRTWNMAIMCCPLSSCSERATCVSLPCYTAQKSVKRDHFMVQKKKRIPTGICSRNICCCLVSPLMLLISLCLWKLLNKYCAQNLHSIRKRLNNERCHNGIMNPHLRGYVRAVNNMAHFSNLICHFVDAPLTVLRYHVWMCSRGASLKSYQIFLDKPGWHLSPSHNAL